MSINTVSGSPATTDIGQLVQRLVSAADKNKDGDLSLSEFGAFLTTLVKGATSPGDGATTTAGKLTATAPALVAALSAPAVLQALPGWDQAKWTNPDHHSTKYEVGHVLAKYPPTVDGLQQAWLELSSLYPAATFDGKDTITGLPGTNGPVDVLVGASAGGRSWAWQDMGSQA